VSYLVYGIVPLGSWGTLYGFSALYLVSILGFGLLVSTLANTQQQAMFVAFFFMLIFILLSGLFTLVESMPIWAQGIAKLTPAYYFVEVLRMIILKGATFADVTNQFLIVLAFGLVLNALAIWNYRKRA
jgi:ABC-2 type transport system permease protein